MDGYLYFLPPICSLPLLSLHTHAYVGKYGSFITATTLEGVGADQDTHGVTYGPRNCRTKVKVILFPLLATVVVVGGLGMDDAGLRGGERIRNWGPGFQTGQLRPCG